MTRRRCGSGRKARPLHLFLGETEAGGSDAHLQGSKGCPFERSYMQADWQAMGILLVRVLAVVAIVVTLYWAIWLPNPGGLERKEAVTRLMVRILAVIVMAILAIYLAVTANEF